MAGAAGFEPTHARIKTWCLTAWRRPCRVNFIGAVAVVRTLGGYGRGGWIRTNACQDQNLVPYRLATPLYRTTCVLRTRFLRQFFKASVQHRNVTPVGNETWQSVWKLAADLISLSFKS